MKGKKRVKKKKSERKSDSAKERKSERAKERKSERKIPVVFHGLQQAVLQSLTL